MSQVSMPVSAGRLRCTAADAALMAGCRDWAAVAGAPTAMVRMECAARDGRNALATWLPAACAPQHPCMQAWAWLSAASGLSAPR